MTRLLFALHLTPFLLLAEKNLNGGVGVSSEQPMPPPTAQHGGNSANGGSDPEIPSQIALHGTHHFHPSQLGHLCFRQGFQPLPLEALTHPFRTCQPALASSAKETIIELCVLLF